MKQLVALLAVVVQLACAPAELGGECENADACAEGLQCVPTENPQPDDNGDLVCTEAGSFCSLTCTVDADCASLGEGVICIADCSLGACFVGSRG